MCVRYQSVNLAVTAPLTAMLLFGVQSAEGRSTVADETSDDVIVVKATRKLVAVDRRSYDISTGPDAQSIVARDAIERLPGVITEIDGQISILGQSNITYLVNGEFFPQSLARQIPAQQIERIEIITNAGADQQGEGVTINIVLKKRVSTPQSFTINGRADSRERYRGAINYNYNSDRWQHIARASYEASEVLRSTVSELTFLAEEQAGETALRRTDRRNNEDRYEALSLLTRKLPKGRKLGLVTGASSVAYEFDNDVSYVRRDEEDILLDQTEDSVFSTRFDTANVALGYGREIDIGNSFSTSLSLNLTQGDRSRDEVFVQNTQTGTFVRDVSQHGSIASFLFKRDIKFDEGLELKTGIELRYREESNDYIERGSVVSGGIIPGQYDYDIFSGAMYGSYGFSLSGVQLLSGFRFEVLEAATLSDGRAGVGTPSYTRFLPSLHVGRSWKGLGTLKASIARKSLTPSYTAFDSVRRQTNFDTFEQGNSQLEIGTSTNLEASHEIEIGDTSFLTTLYHREKENDIESFSDFIGNDLFLRQFINTDSDVMKGINLSITQKLGKKFEHKLDLSGFQSEQEWTLDNQAFSTSLQSYNAKYNFEFRPSKRHNFLMVVQQEGDGLNLYTDKAGLLSSTARYVRKFDNRVVLTFEAINFLATDQRDLSFASDTLRRQTTENLQERGFRVTLSKQL